ncbi:unnamed protein product [Triticum aestivum]|uniref:Uncharacterized protein n=1 Tax=Triticum aestivum TaxID=4565 RepID=A0A7H4LNQ1_WHEAT|nr:unnamed protein product [Triticum aestivum]
MAAAHAEAAASPTHRASIQATSTPPYPSAARIADSSCFPQYTASLKCLETNHQDKSKCQQQFDDYKECKKRELWAYDLFWLQKQASRVAASYCFLFLRVVSHIALVFHYSQREARLERNRSRTLFG